MFQNRICNDETDTSCKHSANEVLDNDFAGSSDIKDKITDKCGPDSDCAILKERILTEIENVRTRVRSLFADSETATNSAKEIHDQAMSKFKSFSPGVWKNLVKPVNPLLKDTHEVRIENMLKTVPDEVKAILQNAISQAVAGTDLGTDRDEEALSQTATDVRVKSLQTFLRNGEGDKEEARNTAARLEKIEKHLDDVKEGLNSMGQVSGLSKTLTAVEGIGSAIYKFQYAKNADGTWNLKKIASGVLDIVNGMAEFLPRPVSTVSATVTKLFNLFTNGGSPTQTQILKDAFAKQTEMIKEEFKNQRKAFQTMLDASELQSIETKAMGVLEALSERDEFISAYDGLETCLSDTVAAEITERVSYFTDQAEVFTIRHVFEQKCLQLAKKSALTLEGFLSEDEIKQSRACTTLLYTDLTIEKKKRHILSRMIGLLSSSKNHYQVSDGYLRVQNNEGKTLSAWLENTFLDPPVQDVFCGMFFYDMCPWDHAYGDNDPRSMTLELMGMFSNRNKVANINCINKGTFNFRNLKHLKNEMLLHRR